MSFILFLLALAYSLTATAQAVPSFLTISNRQMTVRQDLTRGGAISHIMRRGEERSLVNIYDEGRYIQQSYYAGNSIDRKSEGQSSFWSPWPWNPIQVGDYARNRAEILEYRQTHHSTYVRCIPMLWDMNNKPAEAVMEQWTQLDGRILHVRCRLTCHRTDTIYGESSENSQEIPAVYPISALNHLYYYQGDAPFSGAKADSVEVEELRFVEPKHGWGSYPDVPEHWMAFVDDEGWGMGVYSPSATSFLAGRYKPKRDGESLDEGTSYIAPVRQQHMSHDSVVEYEYYIILGTVAQIQHAVRGLKGKVKVKG
ncbi:MAG: hypothetical protein K5945_01120 [Bacteroidaceae bacterium]|nr:hypothetical protein [Bacteroidaceae bacterium]